MGRILAIAATVFLCTTTLASAAGTECSMKTIKSCENTNSLVWAKSFQSALERFAGTKKVRWLGAKMTLADVVSEVLGGGADDRIEVAPGLYRFNAFRPDSATERGAVFIDASGVIKAAGVLHFNCEKSCSKSYHLAIILKEKDAALEKLVSDWGAAETKKNADDGFGEDLSTISETAVIIPDK